ncbi:general substrate transporter [Acephala macrosclerotiorum]|nr:general substrate transporter [Acephala macrosclerotiorum]
MEEFRRGRLTTFWEERRVIFICFLIGFAQFQYGYDSAAVSGFQSMPGFLRIFGYPAPEITIGYNISTKVQRLIQSLMNLGGLTAAFGCYALGPRASRRVGLWIACAIGVIAISLQIGSTTLGALYAGRFLLGISNGFYLTFSVTYMSEIAPAHLRGSVVGLVTFHTSLGALIGILIENYTSKSLERRSYQIPLAAMYPIPVLMTVALLFLPDTPRYYVSRGKHDSAIRSIQKTRGIKDMDRILAEITDIQNNWDTEQELHKDARIMDMFRSPDLRRTLITFGCSIGQTATGVLFLAGYSVYFYVQARIGSPFVWVMIGLAIALTGNLGAFPAMRFFGRRPLLIGTSIVSSVMMFGMAIVYTKSANGTPAVGKALVALSIIFTWTYGLGQGPVLWAITSEIPSQRLRSQTVGIANGLNFVFGWLCSFCTPYFINPTSLNWGPKYGYIWGASNLILAIWVFFFVPETKGRSLEQLDELFEKGVETWKFAKYLTEHQTMDADKVFEGGSDEKGVRGDAYHVEDVR